MLDYLFELRKRALIVCFIFLAFFLFYYFFANELFITLTSPLLKALPSNGFLIASKLSSPLVVPLEIAASTAFLTTLPFALWQFWRFIAPSLYLQERRLFGMLIIVSFLLFLAGISFCYYFILPFMFQLFAKALPINIHFLPDISLSYDFITKMLLIFGLSFQIPILCVFLVLANITELTYLKQIRPFIIVIAFVVGMILTPPDVISQVLLAIPLCLLYELGLILAHFFIANKKSWPKKCI